MTFGFTPTTGLLDTTTYPTTPANETAARQQFMDLFNQLRDYMNNNILDANGFLNGSGLNLTGKAVIKNAGIPISADGSVCMAYGARIQGLFFISWSSNNREHRITVSVVGNQFDTGARVAILNDYAYQSNKVVTNIRFAKNADGSIFYLLCDVANRNSAGPDNLNVEWVGSGQNIPTLGNTAFGTTSVTNSSDIAQILSGGNKGQSGTVLTSSSTFDATVTFPVSYSSAPIVVAAPWGTSVASECVISAITANTFTVKTFDGSGNPAVKNVNWIALGV